MGKNSISLKVRNNIRVSTLSLLILNTVLEFLARPLRQEAEIKAIESNHPSHTE
jgi:hypothetical protein